MDSWHEAETRDPPGMTSRQRGGGASLCQPRLRVRARERGHPLPLRGDRSVLYEVRPPRPATRGAGVSRGSALQYPSRIPAHSNAYFCGRLQRDQRHSDARSRLVDFLPARGEPSLVSGAGNHECEVNADSPRRAKRNEILQMAVLENPKLAIWNETDPRG